MKVLKRSRGEYWIQLISGFLGENFIGIKVHSPPLPVLKGWFGQLKNRYIFKWYSYSVNSYQDRKMCKIKILLNSCCHR